jgi:hypothetical protein
MIRIASGKDLGLGLKPPKGTGMNDSVSVALEIVAIGMPQFRMTPTARLLHLHGVWSQRLHHCIIASSERSDSNISARDQ